GAARRRWSRVPAHPGGIAALAGLLLGEPAKPLGGPPVGRRAAEKAARDSGPVAANQGDLGDVLGVVLGPAVDDAADGHEAPKGMLAAAFPFGRRQRSERGEGGATSAEEALEGEMGILLAVLPLRGPPIRVEGRQGWPLVDEDEADALEVRFLDVSKMTDDPADR